MSGKLIFVAGDNLSSRSECSNLVALSQLGGLLDGEPLSGPLPVVVPGQGVEAYEREMIRATLRRRGLPESMLADAPLPVPLPYDEVHKRNPDNVLIAGLHRVEDDLFRATLRISDRQELVLDHSTGSHITGMLITEAVRQVTLAVGERYLLASSGRSRFLLNSLETKFHKFLLPLPTQLECAVEDLRRKGPTQLRFRCRCDLIQAGTLAASGSMDVTVMDEERADRIEADTIRETTRALAELHREAEDRAAQPALSGVAAPSSSRQPAARPSVG
ncbi:AfsA-related hotdog domain-containing protein [Streptomyces sp. NPDC021212]|uniref:AfsA-related hotdog domain-containing protein n=1 Tax=Streptomyces sp. NPDC021212 TaxID=3365118 RepID=UPI0037956914